MKKTDLLQESMIDIDEKYVLEAENCLPKKKIYKRPAFYSCVAAMLIIAIIIPFLKGSIERRSADGNTFPVENTDSTTEMKEGSTVLNKIGDSELQKEYYDMEMEMQIDGDVRDSDKQDESFHVLTASVWNDNENFSEWQELFYVGQTGISGKFCGFTERWKINPIKRVKIHVRNGEKGIGNAVIYVNNTRRTVTDMNGVAYLFGISEGDVIKAVYDTESIEIELKAENEITLNLSAEAAIQEKLDLMFVIDVTGSMGDELEFLKNEIQNVIKRIQEDNRVSVRVSVVYYRDSEDDETVFLSDFDDAGQLGYLEKLKSEKANGGGDYEEAIDLAMKEACYASWANDSVKIIFHLFDAPMHEDESVISSYNESTCNLISSGVHICPVIASGSDVITEFIARTEAILSNGRFIYLTDDSGVGSKHYEIGLSADVEYLDDLMVRIAGGYLTGDFGAPKKYESESEADPSN